MIVLHGYQYSVYLRIVRMVLVEKGVPYSRVEVNPFASDMPKEYLDLHPFRRVPTLVHDDYVLYGRRRQSRGISTKRLLVPPCSRFTRAREPAWHKSFRSSTPTAICQW